jgi:hypothetical protein
MEGEQTPFKSPKLAARIIEGEAVIINLPSQEALVLNPVGTRIWEMIDGKKTVREIASLIASEYQISQEIALQDTIEFINELKDILLFPPKAGQSLADKAI